MGGEYAILAAKFVRPEKGKRGGRDSGGARGDLRALRHGDDAGTVKRRFWSNVRENCGRKEGRMEEDGSKECRIGKKEGDRAEGEEEEKKRSWRKPEGVKAAMGEGNDGRLATHTLKPSHPQTLTLNPWHTHTVLPIHRTTPSKPPIDQAKAINLPYDCDASVTS
jgi:hypothetical protein